MSSPVSASAGGRFPLSVHSPVARFVPQPLIRSSPANRLQPTQLLVQLPRLPGSHPSRDRLVATWLPSPFLPGPTVRPEDLPAEWIIPLPNPLSPRELGWPSVPRDDHCWQPRFPAPFLGALTLSSRCGRTGNPMSQTRKVVQTKWSAHPCATCT